ncbi:MAG: hypothetical protein ABR879_09110 [Methanomassiliicoccales archaeon]|jgi:hypothetical protein
MEAQTRFSFVDNEGKVIATGDATASIEIDALQIRPKGSEVLWHSLRDITAISGANYHLNIDLATGESLVLFNLGYGYEDFLRTLHQTRNELVLHDLLMQEKVRKKGTKAEYRSFDPAGKETAKVKCEPRLLDSSLVVLPEGAELIRLRYSDIVSVNTDNFTLKVATESGKTLEFIMLGRELEPTRKALTDAVAEMSAKVQAMLKDAYPEGDGSMIAKAAKLMRDGRAAKKADIEAACPGLWSGLEMKVAGYDMEEEYKLLTSLAQKELVRIGMKRSLVQGEDAQGKLGEYVFFLAPIYSTDSGKGGNALAFEAASGEDEGRATYFFRIMERDEYRGTKRMDELDSAAERFMDDVVMALIAINFRREPIYLDNAKLYTPQYSQYRYALAKIPELKLLRERFVGRVIHSDPLQWATDVSDLLKFNVTTKDPKARWVKSEESAEGMGGAAPQP